MRHSLGLKALLPKLTHNAGLATTPTPALQFYHITNIHNNEDTGQIAHSAHARNATPSAKMAISSGFGMMLSLFNDAGLPRLPCLIHHSPPVGRAISVCRRKRRQIAICGRFPDPVRCNSALLTSPPKPNTGSYATFLFLPCGVIRRRCSALDTYLQSGGIVCS